MQIDIPLSFELEHIKIFKTTGFFIQLTTGKRYFPNILKALIIVIRILIQVPMPSCPALLVEHSVMDPV